MQKLTGSKTCQLFSIQQCQQLGLFVLQIQDALLDGVLARNWKSISPKTQIMPHDTIRCWSWEVTAMLNAFIYLSVAVLICFGMTNLQCLNLSVLSFANPSPSIPLNSILKQMNWKI